MEGLSRGMERTVNGKGRAGGEKGGERRAGARGSVPEELADEV